jgi:hypothetical protein
MVSTLLEFSAVVNFFQSLSLQSIVTLLQFYIILQSGWGIIWRGEWYFSGTLLDILKAKCHLTQIGAMAYNSISPQVMTAAEVLKQDCADRVTLCVNRVAARTSGRLGSPGKRESLYPSKCGSEKSRIFGNQSKRLCFSAFLNHSDTLLKAEFYDRSWRGRHIRLKHKCQELHKL